MNCASFSGSSTNHFLHVYFQESPDLGEILVTLNYLPGAGRLNVDVIKAKSLLQTDLVGGSGEFPRR